MRTNAKFILFYNVLESFFTTWALMKASRMEPGNVLTGVFFLLCFFLYRHIHERLKTVPPKDYKTASRLSLVLSVLFIIMFMAIDSENYVKNLTNPLFRLIILLSVFIGFLFLFYYLLMFLFSYMDNINSVNAQLLQPEDRKSSCAVWLQVQPICYECLRIIVLNH